MVPFHSQALLVVLINQFYLDYPFWVAHIWINCGWSDARTVMLAAAATHSDVSSTVYYAVWCQANYFCALEMSPLRLPVAVHILGVSPGPQVFLFLNADSAGSSSGCQQYRTHAINL